MRTINRDREWFSKGSFIGYCSPWSDSSDPTVKFQDWIDFDTDLFPNVTVFGWSWPETVNVKTGVRGYNHIAYGKYDGGVPLVSIPPVTVKNIKRFDQSFSWEPSGDDPARRYNTLTEFFLTRGGVKVLEVGWFLHYPPETLAFLRKDTGVGNFSDQDGRVWTVSYHPGPIPYVTLYPPTDLLTDAIDMKAVLQWLTAKGIVKGDETVSGCGFGFEPLAGTDRATVNFWNPVLT